MHQVDIHEAETRLSLLIEEIVSGRNSQIIIARNGKPVARLIAFSKPGDISKRIGIARGKFVAPEPSEDLDNQIAGLFAGEKLE